MNLLLLQARKAHRQKISSQSSAAVTVLAISPESYRVTDRKQKSQYLPGTGFFLARDFASIRLDDLSLLLVYDHSFFLDNRAFTLVNRKMRTLYDIVVDIVRLFLSEHTAEADHAVLSVHTSQHNSVPHGVFFRCQRP